MVSRYPLWYGHPLTSGTVGYNEWSLSGTQTDDLVAIVSTTRTSLWVVDPSSPSPKLVPSFEGEGWDGVAWIGDRIATGNITSFTIHTPDGTRFKPTSYSDVHRKLIRCGPSHLVFFGADAKHGGHIGYFDLETKTAIPITEGPSEDVPSCTPDGATLVYWHSDQHSDSYIATKTIPSGAPSRITPAGMRVIGAVVSPDGKSVFVWREPDPKTPLEWGVLVQISGGPPRPISMPVPYSASGLDLRWSADGKSILYAWYHDGVGNLWSLPIAGGHPRQLTHFDADRIFAFDVAPDGKLLVSRGKWINDVVMISHAR